MNRSNHETSRLSRQLWARYVLALLAWAFAVLLMAFFARMVCGMRSWDGGEILYPLIHWMNRNVVLLYLFVTGAGWLVISYRFIARPIRYLDAVAEAAQALARPGEDPIVLPPALEQTETQLNLAREKALRDAMAAREAEQRKNDLIVYLAHDLKTPLTSVIGYLTLLRDEPQLSQELRGRYTGIALEKAERLEDLINEFFEIAKFSLSDLELEKRPIDLARMLRQVASEFQPQFAQSGLTCALDLPPALEYACDPDKLARVFDNLLRNACRYSTPGTQVRISAAVEERDIVLTFTNTGIAIPPEKLERIFEQFFRLDASRATRTGGAGLGLAIAKEIVSLHGGAISARSADGVTAFTVSLPAP